MKRPVGKQPRNTSAKELGGRCKECARLTYKRRAAREERRGLTARGRPRYPLRTHCPHGHLRSENEGASQDQPV